MKSSDIHIRAISQEMPQPSITRICLKRTYMYLKFNSNIPGANEWIINDDLMLLGWIYFRKFTPWIIYHDHEHNRIIIVTLYNMVEFKMILLNSLLPSDMIGIQDPCQHVDGLVQERRNSIANTLELHLFCTIPSICSGNDMMHDGTKPLPELMLT